MDFTVYREIFYPEQRVKARSPHKTPDVIPFFHQILRKVGTVLARNTCNQSPSFLPHERRIVVYEQLIKLEETRALVILFTIETTYV